jgi:hypothetical protein
MAVEMASNRTAPVPAFFQKVGGTEWSGVLGNASNVSAARILI